jgi:hypothetical protein
MGYQNRICIVPPENPFSVPANYPGNNTHSYKA